MDEITQPNTSDLDAELNWLAKVVDLRLHLYFGDLGARERNDDHEHEKSRSKSGLESDGPAEVDELPPPELSGSSTTYATFVNEHGLSWRERVALSLAMTPDLRPRLLDAFAVKNTATDRRFTEFGGVRLGREESLYPTGETLAFVLGGAGLDARLYVGGFLDPEHLLARLGVLRPELSDRALPVIKAPLRLSPEALSLFTTGRESRPIPGVDFPAERIETALAWDDLVLHRSTQRRIEEIQIWLEHGETLMNEWGMGAKLRPGHRCLFHGPPGTGKSMTACLLGASSGHDVFRVDLSLVVSKYIGETEKNLAKVFDRAQQRGWILFFDEADALFGRRSETRDAHDRYANQEVAYLLQRIESFDGVLILASNLRENLDDAFTRRFESVIYFPMPRAEERVQLWAKGFPSAATLAADVDLRAIACAHELSGGAIMNVVRQVCLESLAAEGRPSAGPRRRGEPRCRTCVGRCELLVDDRFIDDTARARAVAMLQYLACEELDGAWLLRVERAAYDLVLDRFPWDWTWVRLPWMAESLHVEW